MASNTGCPGPNLKFQTGITQKLCISNPILVKPTCIWQWNDFLKDCKQTADKNVNNHSDYFGFTNLGSEILGF